MDNETNETNETNLNIESLESFIKTSELVAKIVKCSNYSEYAYNYKWTESYDSDIDDSVLEISLLRTPESDVDLRLIQTVLITKEHMHEFILSWYKESPLANEFENINIDLSPTGELGYNIIATRKKSVTKYVDGKFIF